MKNNIMDSNEVKFCMYCGNVIAIFVVIQIFVTYLVNFEKYFGKNIIDLDFKFK